MFVQLKGQKLLGTTTGPLTVLPPANRKDPSLAIPPIEEKVFLFVTCIYKVIKKYLDPTRFL